MIRHIHLRVRSLTQDTEGFLRLELVPLRADLLLPAFEAGAHIELNLRDEGGEQVLSCPLTSDPSERHRYCVAVQSSDNSKSNGNAAWLPAQLRPGQTLRVSAPRGPMAGAGGFTVRLRRTGRDVPVRAGQTILEALLAEGLQPAHSCRSGTCGTCEMAVLAGEPEHHDRLLSDAERATNRRMMICCGRSKTPVLELDF